MAILDRLANPWRRAMRGARPGGSYQVRIVIPRDGSLDQREGAAYSFDRDGGVFRTPQGAAARLKSMRDYGILWGMTAFSGRDDEAFGEVIDLSTGEVLYSEIRS